MVLEYLILIKEEKDNSFCASTESFLNFLKADSSIKIDSKKIIFTPKVKGQKLQVNYILTSGEVDNNNERYFLLNLSRSDTSRNEQVTELTRKLKKIIERINPNNVKIKTLWDDIALDYANQAYPIISDLENSMRKLIAKFMNINVGMDWSKKSIHSDITNKIVNKSNSNDSYYDDIYKTDFIELSYIMRIKS